MDLKTIQEYYPIYNTLVGFFDSESLYYFDTVEDIKHIEYWDDTPFYTVYNSYGFLEYCGDNKYKSWSFSFQRIAGYFSDGDYDDFSLMIYSSDYGWEKIDPDVEDDQYIVIEPPDEDETYNKKIIKAFEYWHPTHGKIFTDAKELKEFIEEKKK